MEEYTNFKKSYFLRTKNQVTPKGLEFFFILQSNGIKVKVFRGDNGAENKIFFKEKKIKLCMDARFEVLAPGTPQQNGVVERAFATLYGRVQAMLNNANLEGDICKSLWAECAKIATALAGILYGKNQTENSYTKMFQKNPGFISHLRIFGEMGFVLTYRQIGYKSKIGDKGKEFFFVGYATEHAGDVYRMYDPNTKRIKISRDVKWMGKFFNDGHPIKISEYKKNKSRNMKSIPSPIRYDDAQKESNLMRQQLNEKQYFRKSNYKQCGRSGSSRRK